MRKSRAKQAAPGLYPENIPGFKKPKPVVTVVRGVPVPFAFEFAQTVQTNGIAFNAGLTLFEPDRTAVYSFTTGGIAFVSFVEQSRRFRNFSRLYLAANEWSCEMELQHWMMGGEDCFKLWGKYYAVYEYTMVDKHAWLRDMTIARMMTDEWRANGS